MIKLVVGLLAILDLVLFKKYIDVINILNELNEDLVLDEELIEDMSNYIEELKNKEEQENKKELLFEEDKNNGN